MEKRKSKRKSPKKKKSLQKKTISENTLDSSRTIDSPSRFLTLLICLVLILAASAVYWHVTRHDFVFLDDDLYVYENRHVQNGLTSDSMIWAFTATDSANWHPLTWLSHMLDFQLYGLNPEGHHLTNVFFHLVNTLLLFLVLKWMTGGLWRSGLVAALFALHPLHVESVAWVSERKDVLSTLFWMLTLWAYFRYVQRPTAKRYLLILLPFALGLMAKPMLVTLPCVLLLLDYWPLERIQLGQASISGTAPGVPAINAHTPKRQAFRLLVEKTLLCHLGRPKSWGSRGDFGGLSFQHTYRQRCACLCELYNQDDLASESGSLLPSSEARFAHVAGCGSWLIVVAHVHCGNPSMAALSISSSRMVLVPWDSGTGHWPGAGGRTGHG